MSDNRPGDRPAPRARDLPLGALCRIGFVLSACFWVPLGLIWGIGRATGAGYLTWFGQDVGAVLAIPAGPMTGVGISLFNDALLAIGALVFIVIRRFIRR